MLMMIPRKIIQITDCMLAHTDSTMDHGFNPLTAE